MKELSNQGGIPDEAIIRAPNILSDNPEGVALQLNVFFNRCHEALNTRKLQSEELKGVSGIITHIVDVLDLDYANPLVKNGLDVIHSHFVRVFGIESTTNYESIFQEAHDRGYFEGRDIDNEELNAFVVLEDCFIEQFKRELASKGESLPELDFSRLVNPDWKPQ